MASLPARLGRYLFLSFFAVFLALPLVIVAGVSVNGTRRMRFPPDQWSARWYVDFFNDPSWMSALRSSLLVGSFAALLAATVALPICYFEWKYRLRLARTLNTFGRVPFMLPPVVLSVVFLVFWSLLSHVGRMEDVVVGHAVVFLQLPLAAIGLGFVSIDRSLIEAAQTMGARDADIFRTIVLPMIMPYLISGMLFVCLLSLNEYIIAQMVVGFAIETLPIKIFNSLRVGFSPTMCVGAVLFMLAGLIGYTLIAMISDLPKLLGSDKVR
ncbi:MAG: putative spermidine/putrescine transport system permease protein [Gammaproteobacteria bacterium]|jgi:putative spermidine/putrescine transport system permease protein|nr:putative spermidine/putrescine transport system permease protein [Gammaproteobacteria bacterium]